MNRAIIYFLYHPQGDLPDYVIYKLNRLRPHASYIRVVVNGNLSDENVGKLEEIVDAVQLRPNVGLDVGAYKDAMLDFGFDNLQEFDELILMNYTWYGPIGSFTEVFESMDRQDVDFWGMTEHGAVRPNPITHKGSMRAHLQSHWIAVRKSMLTSIEWRRYWNRMPEIKDYSDSILKHESRFTGYFSDRGFSYVAAYPLAHYGVDHPAFVCADQLMRDGCPVLKRRPFFHDPLYLDREAIIGRDLIETAQSLGYPTPMIWSDLVHVAPPKILNTNTGSLEVLSDAAPRGGNIDVSIAAVVHMYYPDMANELIEHIRFLPGSVEIYVTTDSADKAAQIQSAYDSQAWRAQAWEIRILESNRGRDLAAYFIGCSDVITNSKFDLIVKIHSKKSEQVGATAGNYFKRQQIENLLNSPGYARSVVDLFRRDPQLGIVFPPTIHIGHPTLGGAWFGNKKRAKKYARELGITVPLDLVSPLGAFGAMWICRPQALELMASRSYEYKDYSSEKRHRDGSLAHVQERMVAYSAAQSGYKTKTVANARYIAVSHAMLEYKLDQILSVIHDHALFSLPKFQHIVNHYHRMMQSKRQTIKFYLLSHHRVLGRFLRILYLPVRKVRLSVGKSQGEHLKVQA